MTIMGRISSALVVIMFVVVIGIAIAYWQSGNTPPRPRTVAQGAVFLWAPNLPFPRPRRGWWLSCRYDQGHDVCTLSGVDGKPDYVGEFVTYRSQGVLSDSQLAIDPEKSTDHNVWIEGQLVPLIYLKNGEILIPKDKYDQGSQMLDQLKP